MSKEEEIAENGLIAYCIMMFSQHTMLNFVMAERLKEIKKMNVEGLSIKQWVQKKFEDAIERATEGIEQGASEYDYGELMGIVRGYHNVLVELGPAGARTREYNTFNAPANCATGHMYF